jgi:hypothetical protein
MQILRYPFYFRTTADAEVAKIIVDKLNRLVHNTNMKAYPYRFRQVELKMGAPVLWKRNRSIVPKVADTRKWIGVIIIGAVAHKMIDQPDVAAMLRAEGLEPVEQQNTPAPKFEAAISVAVNITSKDKMRKLASALDKRVGQGLWRLRGHHGYKKQLTVLLQNDKRKRIFRIGEQPVKRIPVTIHVDKAAQITQSELEKLIFTINLKS